jgi:hypothetical protein
MIASQSENRVVNVISQTLLSNRHALRAMPMNVIAFSSRLAIWQQTVEKPYSFIYSSRLRGFA